MLLIAVAAIAVGQRPITPVPRLLAVMSGWLIATGVLSAYVLFAEFVWSRERWLVVLGSAYLLPASLLASFVATFPSVFLSNAWLLPHGEVAMLLLLGWHVAFPVLVLCAVLLRGRHGDPLVRPASVVPIVTLAVVACIAIAVATSLLLMKFDGALPLIINDERATRGSALLATVFIVLPTAAALTVLHRTTRNRSILSLLLFLALTASALDGIIAFASLRYSYGWCIGKLFMVATSTLVLSAFIGESGRLREHLARANTELHRSRERERLLAQERLIRLASHDELTGLPNRTRLEERVRQLVSSSRRDGSRFAAIFVSLDGFQNINNVHGRQVGDVILADAATQLRDAVAPADFVARFGGDEFVVVCSCDGNHHDPETIAETLRAAVSGPYQVDDGELRLTASIGIASYPEDGTAAETLVQNAEIASRAAKRDGGHATRVYHRAFVEEARSRRRLRDELVGAVQRDEFVLHYQPIIDLRTGKIEMVEALLRWHRPGQGIVYPDNFIPFAEQDELIVQLGEWVIVHAAHQAQLWRSAGTPQRIAVNVSARQLQDANFLSHLRHACDEALVPAGDLELEVTESAAMRDFSSAQAVLTRAHEMGHKIALDDFGTSYSSLTYLKQLPADLVKIDGSFIKGLPLNEDDAAIVAGTIAMASSLKRFVVAEGVETAAQRKWLRRAGCHFAQGNLFGRPVRAHELMIA